MKQSDRYYLSAALAAMFASPATVRSGAQQAAPPPPVTLPVAEQSAFAAPLPFDRGAAGLAQSLRRLGTRASLLQINAHPDDEDGATLTYESRGVGAEVSLLSLNRGEGGQNVMTPEFWDGLGILRTQEHLAANRYYGVHLFYTRVADFGFSKTREETLKQWGHDRMLADAVRVVRETHPMVITSVFSGNVSDGHGHHQTAGVAAQEVYTAAGDPKMFPEQLREGLHPWTPLKVYARAPFARVTRDGIFDYATGKYEPLLYRNYVTGQDIHGLPPETVSIPSGTYNPLFGESYAQVSREGLNQQKSQNGGVPLPPPGRADASYHLYASRAGGKSLPEHESGFFDGIDTSLEGVAGYLPEAERVPVRAKLTAIAGQVKEAAATFDANDPAKSAPALARGLDLTRALLRSLEEKQDRHESSREADGRFNAIFELRIKERQFNEALAQALGMSLLATVQSAPTPPVPPRGPGAGGNEIASQTVIDGETFGVGIHIADQGSAPVRVDSIALVPAEAADWKVRKPPPFPPANTAGGTAFATEQPPAAAAPPPPPPIGPLPAGTATDEYLLATVPADAPATRPYFSRPSLEQGYYDIHDPRWLTLPEEPYPLQAVVSYTFAGTQATLTQTVQTQHRYNGLGTLQEPLRIAPAISVQVSPPSGVLPLSSSQMPLLVTVHSSVKGPAKGTVKLDLPKGWSAEPSSATFQTSRDNEDVMLRFHVATPGLAARTYRIDAVAEYAGRQFHEGFQVIGYPGVRPYPRFTPSTSTVTGVDMKVAPGLRVGYVMGSGDDVPESLRELGVDPILLSDSDLQRGDLGSFDCIVLGVRTYTARPVLRTANNRLLEYVRNGGVVVTQYQSAEFDHDYGPFPLSVPGDQGHTVVEEDAKVRILKPNDPVLNWPNRITSADFNGWVEERGHGFPKSFAPEYTALTEVHDTGQEPQTGGLIYARSGKGFYVYLAYAFFRELPEGVPGSFRIMANLLSLRKNPEWK